MNSETPKKKITLFPGGFQYVKNYGYSGVDIWMGEQFKNELKNSDCFIGHSGGASFALQHATNQTSKYIFINPLVKRKNIFFLSLRWLKYVFQEGLPREKFIPMKYWLYAFRKVLKSTKIDFLSAVRQIPKENIIIIRGKKDHFFCDEEAAGIIKENSIHLIEVDAGHDWNENITGVVGEIINELK